MSDNTKSSTERQSHWDNRFDSNAPQSLTWYQPHILDSLALIQKYGQDLGPDAAVIDVGAGNAGLVDDLAALGYKNLSVLDISAKALAQTRDRLGGNAENIEFIKADLTKWKPTGEWDIWHDRAAFHFLTGTSEQNAYLDALHSSTHKGALVLISCFSTNGPEKCSGLSVQQYSVADLAARLGEEYELLEGYQKDHITPNGGHQNFTHTAFKRR